MKSIKPNRHKITFPIIAALCLAAAGPVAAAGTAHEHDHAHGAAASTTALHLDAGRKWMTDAALRQAMGNIREAMAAALPEVHENRLPADGYGRLAQRIEDEVGRIVANCKLAPAADAQLHVVVGELLAGAGRMAGPADGGAHRNGAVQVVGALAKYATYFDDPAFHPLAH